MKSLVPLVVLVGVLVAVRAEDYACDVCASVIKDFTPELSDNTLQSYFDRLCNDILDEWFKDYDQTCLEFVDGQFNMIRLLIKLGDSPTEICKTLGMCGWDQDIQIRRIFKKIQQVRGRNLLKQVPIPQKTQ